MVLQLSLNFPRWLEKKKVSTRHIVQKKEEPQHVHMFQPVIRCI